MNADDPWGRRLLEAPAIPMSTFGVDADADLRATDVEVSTSGLVVPRRRHCAIRSSLRGRFNVSNCLAAIATSPARWACPTTRSSPASPTSREVPGRVEPIDEGQEFLVVVDYAHTPDSILGVLQATRPLATGRLIVVFGCGGDRDRAKRPLMGQAATSTADLTIITTDNPRIGGPAHDHRRDRAAAPSRVVATYVDRARPAGRDRAGRSREAGPGDVVVIAGQGARGRARSSPTGRSISTIGWSRARSSRAMVGGVMIARPLSAIAREVDGRLDGRRRR